MSVKNPDRGGRTAAHGDIRATLLLAVLCLIWGTTWPVMKIALVEIPPFSMRSLSTALATLTLYLICAIKGHSLRLKGAKAWAHVAVASLLNIVFFTVLIAFAQLAAATSRVAILAYTLPIWSVLLAWPILGERPGRMQIVALGLCGAGLAVLIYPLADHGIPLGLILALGSGVSWAAGTVYLKWARIDADVMGVTTWQLAIAFVMLTACMFAFEGRLELGAAHADAILATVFIGVASGGFAYALWFETVLRLPAVTSSLAVLSTPVIGALSSIAMLGEVPTAADIVGFTLIVAASGCVMLRPQASAEAMSKRG